VRSPRRMSSSWDAGPMTSIAGGPETRPYRAVGQLHQRRREVRRHLDDSSGRLGQHHDHQRWISRRSRRIEATVRSWSRFFRGSLRRCGAWKGSAIMPDRQPARRVDSAGRLGAPTTVVVMAVVVTDVEEASSPPTPVPYKSGRGSCAGVLSGCGTDFRSKPSMCLKSAGLHVNSGRSLASATAAIIAS